MGEEVRVQVAFIGLVEWMGIKGRGLGTGREASWLARGLRKAGVTTGIFIKYNLSSKLEK